MTTIALRSAREQADTIRSRDISAAELLDVTLERYERLNPKINAVVTTQLGVARERAVAADAAKTTAVNSKKRPMSFRVRMGLYRAAP